jgi:hypothetical protein
MMRAVPDCGLPLEEQSAIRNPQSAITGSSFILHPCFASILIMANWATESQYAGEVLRGMSPCPHNRCDLRSRSHRNLASSCSLRSLWLIQPQLCLRVCRAVPVRALQIHMLGELRIEGVV